MWTRSQNVLTWLTAVLLLMAMPGLVVADSIRLWQLQPTDAEPDASGEVIYGFSEVRPPLHLDVIFQVHVRDVYSTDSVEVWIDDNFIDSFDLVDGQGGFDRDSDQGDEIPSWGPGNTLYVIDPSTGTVLLEVTYD